MSDNNGTPVANASIEAVSAQYSMTTVSSSNGSFVLTLPNGTYQFNVQAAGFVPSEVNITVLGQPFVGLAVPVAMNSTGTSNSSTLILGIVVLVAVTSFGAVGWFTGRRCPPRVTAPPPGPLRRLRIQPLGETFGDPGGRTY